MYSFGLVGLYFKGHHDLAKTDIQKAPCGAFL